MLNDQQILNDIHGLSPEKQAEVLDFIAFVKSKDKQANASLPQEAPKSLMQFAGVWAELPESDWQDLSQLFSNRRTNTRRERLTDLYE